MEVSGSGRMLVHDVLYGAMLRAKGKPTETPGAHRALHGHEHIGDVVLVDQAPIGARRAPIRRATWVPSHGIRELFAASRSPGSRRYSGNLQLQLGHRARPHLRRGSERIEMQFLSDVSPAVCALRWPARSGPRRWKRPLRGKRGPRAQHRGCARAHRQRSALTSSATSRRSACGRTSRSSASNTCVSVA